MMGYEPSDQDQLFVYGIYLEERVRKNHPLRKIKELVDFSFIYDQVKEVYGDNGNVSIPPPVILKLMLLLILYNVRSERELMETLPERLDWLWFLGFTLDTPSPDHSVLSKARTRWGKEAFRRFFEQIVSQCVSAGLVDGTKLFVDASLIDADASNNSVVPAQSLQRYLKKGYADLEERLDEPATEDEPRSDVNRRLVSTTDPDASIVRKGGKPDLTYKTHRAVDPASEIITAVDVTPGAVNEAHCMLPLIEAHETNTGTAVKTVVADSMYGTIENYLALHGKEIRAHIPFLKKTHEAGGHKAEIFPEEAFTYDPVTDTLLCPQGKRLNKRTFHLDRQSTEYIGSKKDCTPCPLRARCTKNKLGRTVHRHLHKDTLDVVYAQAKSLQSKKDLATRKHLMERSFARGTRYGFDHARWRRLWRVTIQELLTATVQNIKVLIGAVLTPTKGVRAQSLGETIALGVCSSSGRLATLVYSLHSRVRRHLLHWMVAAMASILLPDPMSA
jgi:transposase